MDEQIYSLLLTEKAKRICRDLKTLSGSMLSMHTLPHLKKSGEITRKHNAAINAAKEKSRT